MPSPQPSPRFKRTRKPFEEIGAIFNGNEVKIRVPKSTSKPPKLTPSQLKLEQQCTCDEDESVCSETCGLPNAMNGPANNLTFQVPDDMCEAFTSRTGRNSEIVYSKREVHDTMCNVTPKDAPKGVKAQKMLHPDKDVFILKIGKQTDEPNRTGNIEVELVTPKIPAKPKPASHSCKTIQCDCEDITCCAPCRPCKPVSSRRKKCVRRPCCSQY